jgi:hypothetical protein
MELTYLDEETSPSAGTAARACIKFAAPRPRASFHPSAGRFDSANWRVTAPPAVPTASESEKSEKNHLGRSVPIDTLPQIPGDRLAIRSRDASEGRFIYLFIYGRINSIRDTFEIAGGCTPG